jgi:hypothetical protein
MTEQVETELKRLNKECVEWENEATDAEDEMVCAQKRYYEADRNALAAGASLAAFKKANGIE